MTTALVVLGVLVLVGILLVLPRVDVHHPLVTLFRVLVPSWRFFDSVSSHPTLLVRISETGPDGELGPWRRLLPPPAHAWWHVVWNPAGNLSFASHSVLGRLRSDLAERDDDDPTPPSELVSYQLVLNLVRWWLHDRPAGTPMQFRLTDGEPIGGIEPFELIVSEVHAL